VFAQAGRERQRPALDLCLLRRGRRLNGGVLLAGILCRHEGRVGWLRLLLGPPPEIWIPPPALGSGKSAMPWARMHWVNLTAFSYCLAAITGLGGVVTLAPTAATVVPVVLPMRATEDGDAPPPQAATSKLKPARVSGTTRAKRLFRRGWGKNWRHAMATFYASWSNTAITAPFRLVGG